MASHARYLLSAGFTAPDVIEMLRGCPKLATKRADPVAAAATVEFLNATFGLRRRRAASVSLGARRGRSGLRARRFLDARRGDACEGTSMSVEGHRVKRAPPK